MLQLSIATSPEFWDNENEVFVPPQFQTIELEHSLASISKWESKWHKAFLTKNEKTSEAYFIQCMIPCGGFPHSEISGS